jgi:protein TonB
LPRYRSTPEPEYPAAARRERQEGVVLLAVEVSAQGRPTEVVVKRSSGFELLDRSAVRAVRRWRFEPARTAGLPIASHVEIPVRFRLDD